MKKKILVFSLLLTFILVSLYSNYVYAETNKLEQLADIFNNCKTVKSYQEYNYNLRAKVEGNKIIIETSSEGMQISVEYTLNGSILSGTMDFNGLMSTVILLDCVGQLNGYEDGALFETANSDEISNYTVENEGFELKDLQNENYEVMIDIDKKIPVVDSSKIYLNTNDFDLLKEVSQISGIKSKMSFYVSIDNDNEKAYIYIGERENITESTYKSILSAIEVIFNDNKAVEYFKSNYSEITDGKKQFDGFIVDVDVENDEEISTFENSKTTKVIIDMKAANEAINKKIETENEPIKEETETINEDSILKETANENKTSNPRTGDNIVIYAVTSLISIAIILLLIVVYRKRIK